MKGVPIMNDVTICRYLCDVEEPFCLNDRGSRALLSPGVDSRGGQDQSLGSWHLLVRRNNVSAMRCISVLLFIVVHLLVWT
jgi:hypothetical protein